jgi:hypothetical protein
MDVAASRCNARACGGLHYINPLSGRVLGNDDMIDSGDGEDQDE